MDALQRILQDAVDEACANGADIVHDIERRVRWSPQQSRIWVRLYPDGRGGISIERLRHWSEGYSSYRRKVNVLKPDGARRLRRMIENEISLISRLQRRDRESIASSGSRFAPCPTSFVCHPVGRSLALHAGYDLADMTVPVLEKAGDEMRAVQDSHDALARAGNGNGMQRRVRIRDERVLFRDIETTDLSFTDLTSDGPILKVACELPDTVVAAMGMLTLGHVVDHPALDDCRHVRMRKVTRDTLSDRPAIALHLQRLQVPFAIKEKST